MNVRCPKCSKLLFTVSGRTIDIKCLRCRKISSFNRKKGGVYEANHGKTEANQGMVSSAENFIGDSADSGGLQDSDERDKD